MSGVAAQIIKEANEKGYSVANLYQLMTAPAFLNVPSVPTGEWAAQFRKGRDHFDSGRGDSMEAALTDAMRKVGRRAPPAKMRQQELSLEDLS